MRQGGEPQGVQVVRQGEPTPYHCNFNRLYLVGGALGLAAILYAGCHRLAESVIQPTDVRACGAAFQSGYGGDTP